MKNKKLFLPSVILAVAIVLMAAFALVSSIALKPTVTEAEFDVSITYELDGETVVIDETYKAYYTGNGGYTNSKGRNYSGKLGNFEEDARLIVLKEENGGRIELNTNIFPDYMMGDAEEHDYYTYEPFAPQLLYYDSTEQEFTDEETLLEHGAKLVDWEYAEPIENSFVFSHISIADSAVVFPSVIIAVVAWIAVLCLVKKNADYERKPLDVVSTVFNFIIGLTAVPFFAFVSYFADALGDNESIFNQIFYYTAAATMLSIAASVALRRKGYKKTGFAVQFAVPLAFVLFIIVYELILALS